MKLETGIQSDDNIKRMIEQLKNDNKNNNYFQRRRNARTVGEPHSHWMESDYLKRRMKLMQHLMNDMDGCNPVGLSLVGLPASLCMRWCFVFFIFLKSQFVDKSLK